MILNDNSTQQINTLVIQLQNRITNLSNELKSLNKEIDDLDSKISDLERNDSSQEIDADAMNAEIKANTEAISGKADKNHTHIKSEITDFDHNHDDRYYTESEIDTKLSGKSDIGHNHDDRYYTESEVDAKLSGKSDTGHTHTKSEITDFPTSLKNPAALTVNGKTYDGSSAVNSGVQTIENGGTGVTTQADINKAFINNLEIGESDVTDGTEFVSSWASDNGFAETADGAIVNTPYRRKFSAVWGYIKDKISSVLGLTKDNYGGKASTAGTADVLANGSGKLKFFYTYCGDSKRLLKLGTFSNGTVSSFLLTVKRTDGLGFTGYLTINSNSIYSNNIKQFNGYKSSYSIHEITNGELVFLYRNDDYTNDVYIWCPSYGVVSIILMCGENPWAGSIETDVTLTEVSGFSGTLLDKF